MNAEPMLSTSLTFMDFVIIVLIVILVTYLSKDES